MREVKPETAKEQLESIGYWMVAASTAVTDWEEAYETDPDPIRAMLYGLVDDFLDHGDELSALLTGPPFAEVMASMRADAGQDRIYPHTKPMG